MSCYVRTINHALLWEGSDMAIAMSFRDYLDQHGIHYDVLTHDYATSALQTASTAQVPMTQLAKAVIFRDENDDYLMVVRSEERRVGKEERGGVGGERW